MNQVRHSIEFDREYTKLEKRVEKNDGEARYLLRLIDKARKELEKDLTKGIKIPKKKWPKEYIKKYGINNLWKYNLDSFWRMTYTLVSNQIEIMGVVLELMDHKKYDKRFDYK